MQTSIYSIRSIEIAAGTRQGGKDIVICSCGCAGDAKEICNHCFLSLGYNQTAILSRQKACFFTHVFSRLKRIITEKSLEYMKGN